MMLRSVVLPHPEGPSTLISSPGRRSSETSFSACTEPPPGSVKTIETPSTSSPCIAASPLPGQTLARAEPRRGRAGQR